MAAGRQPSTINCWIVAAPAAASGISRPMKLRAAGRVSMRMVPSMKLPSVPSLPISSGISGVCPGRSGEVSISISSPSGSTTRQASAMSSNLP